MGLVREKGGTGPILLGALLIAAGAALLGLWLWLHFGPPVEEPANPGRTPNPSTSPWTHLGWPERLVHSWPWALRLLLPSAALLLIAGLAVLITSWTGRRTPGSSEAEGGAPPGF